MDNEVVNKNDNKFNFAIWVMLSVSLLALIADYMVIPYYAIYFTDVLKFSLVFSGLALAAFSLSSKISNFIGGFLTDRFNPEIFINTGFTLMILSYCSFIFIKTQIMFFIMLIILGVGDGCIGIAMKYKLVAQCKTLAQRARMFSLMSIATNLGSMIGPVVGFWILKYSYSVVFVCVTLIYALAFLSILLFTNRSVKEEVESKDSILGIKSILSHKQFVSFLILILGFYIIFSQFQFSIPIVLKTLYSADAASKISIIFALNGFVIILAQYPITRWLESRNTLNLTLMGFSILVASYGLIALQQYFNTHFGVIYTFVVMFTIGEILFNTFSNSYVATISPEKRLGTYFGFLGVAMGVGSALGNYISGDIISKYVNTAPHLIWIVLISLSTATFILFFMVRGVTRINVGANEHEK